MTDPIQLSAEYGDHGLPILSPTEGCRLVAKKQDKTFTISGNREGLLLLAKALIGLAGMDEREENRGYHVHVDDLYAINDDGIDFILHRDPYERDHVMASSSPR